MKIHRVGSLTLQGRFFAVSAIPEAVYEGYDHSSELAVCEVPSILLSELLGRDVQLDVERIAACEEVTAACRYYFMPLAHCTLDSTKVSWLGDVSCLDALQRASIGCETVAFVSTTKALSVLERRLGDSIMW